MTTKMKKHKRPSKPFAHNSEFFHTVRIDGPLPENIKTALAEIQKIKEAKGKIGVLEISDDDYILVMSRRRLSTVSTRHCNTLPTMEEMLLGMSKRQNMKSRNKNSEFYG